MYIHVHLAVLPTKCSFDVTSGRDNCWAHCYRIVRYFRIVFLPFCVLSYRLRRWVCGCFYLVGKEDPGFSEIQEFKGWHLLSWITCISVLAVSFMYTFSGGNPHSASTTSFYGISEFIIFIAVFSICVSFIIFWFEMMLAHACDA